VEPSAGLDSLLSGTSNHTVFAPTDAAFAKLPAGTLDALLKDKEQLSRILAFHVCKGKTASKYIISGSGQMPTLCELPSTLGAPWKVTLVVDHKMNGKNGQPLVVGQNCAVVQGLQYEVRGGKARDTHPLLSVQRRPDLRVSDTGCGSSTAV
jgi:Fasciclin domain